MCATPREAKAVRIAKIGHALHMRSAHDSLVIDRDIDEELIQRNILLGKGAHQIAMLQACNRKDRRVVHLRVVQTIQKMNASRTGSGNTHP